MRALTRKGTWLLALLIASTVGAWQLIPGARPDAQGLPPHAETAHAAGDVRFFKRTTTRDDRYTRNADARTRAFMNRHFWRSMVFSPYFDDKTEWYPRGWLYFDLYAIYERTRFASDRQRWILRDRSGRKLYIPWDCRSGRCPQYAADVGDPAFRAWWIARAKRAVARGYRGLWIDDVNLEFRVSDGLGRHRTPVDERTGGPMTEAAWRRYVVAFVQEIRRAIPGAEIAHNSIWFAGSPDSHADVEAQVAAADWINLERGANDHGLRGGTGRFSFRTLLAFIDQVHARGKSVIFDAFAARRAAQEYNLATYFLVSGSRDAVGLESATPVNWWRGYELGLGRPVGAREEIDGILRRQFERGLVIVNPPGGAARRVALPAPMRTISGRTVSTVTLAAAGGVVLRPVA